jgi:hypothetical protein
MIGLFFCLPATNKNTDSEVRKRFFGSRGFYVWQSAPFGLCLPVNPESINRSVFFCPLRVFSSIRFCHQQSSFFF